MTSLRKHHGNIIGSYVYNDAKTASGVWNLRQVHSESMDMRWAEQVMYDSNRDGYGMWNFVGSAGLNNSVGAPTTPSLTVTNVGDYAYAQPISNYADNDLLSSTIEMDVYLTSGAIGIHFASTSGGQGPFLKFDVRGGSNFTGIMYSTNWLTSGSQPIAGTQNVANGWRKVKIQLSAASNVYWYTENNFRDDQITLYNGNYIGITKYADNSIAYIDNIKIYRGFV
jgi:hypothetical protein